MQRAVGGNDQMQDREGDEQHEGGRHVERPSARREQADQSRAAGRRHRYERGAHHASAVRPFKANKPCGRFCMKKMMNTSTAILASTAPDHASRNLLTMPSPSAA